VRREVWERDGGCCQWALDSGGVCGSRLRVQLDHVTPKPSGGKSVTSNLRVLCERLRAPKRVGRAPAARPRTHEPALPGPEAASAAQRRERRRGQRRRVTPSRGRRPGLSPASPRSGSW
jgi:5-methylcytosine-specific restriction endonuclease McrA